MRSRIRHLAAAAAIVVASNAAGSTAQPVRTADAGGGLYLHQLGDRAVVRGPEGEVSELILPPGASLGRLRAIDGGFLAAGEVDAPGLSDLYLVASEEGVARPFPVPANEPGDPLRAGPMPLVEGGRLAGLAWLSGAGVRRTAVYAAAWGGLDWSLPELVSPAGPGTQIAIDGAVLADGSWLLVWASFDGGDDEILWSRRVGGRWSEPAMLHPPNDWPDIRPSLVATGRGALAAWSGFDGESYRVRLAAFEDGVWRQLEPAAQPATRPGLTPVEGGALLLYRTAAPPAWTLLQLDDRGTELRQAVVERRSFVRPAVVVAGPARQPGAPWLYWPGAGGAAAAGVEVDWQTVP